MATWELLLLESILKPGGVYRVEGRRELEPAVPEPPIQECLWIPNDRSLGGECELL